MSEFNCKLSFEAIVEAEDKNIAMEKFMELVDGLAMGWETDNTEIEEIEE